MRFSVHTGTMSKLTSFKADIRPLFTQRDIQGMSKAFNLASYDDVKTHAAAIFDRIRGIGGGGTVVRRDIISRVGRVG